MFVLVLSPSLNRQKKHELNIVLLLPLARRTKMGRIKTPKVVVSVKELENPEEWSYFTNLELVKSRGSSVCLTCEHFTYTCDKSCVTLLTCPLHQRLIPQGEHLTKRCLNWQKKRVLQIGWCPEVA